MHKFLDGIFRNVMAAEQKLSKNCLPASLNRRAFEIRCATCVPRPTFSGLTTCPCFPTNKKLSIAFDKIYGAQTVQLGG